MLPAAQLQVVVAEVDLERHRTRPTRRRRWKRRILLEGSDKLARDAFVHSGKVFTSLVVFNASIISHNSGAPTDITVGAP